MIEVYVKEITDADKSLTVIGKVDGLQVISINTSFGVAKIGMSTALPTDFKYAEEVVKCMQKAMDLYKTKSCMVNELKEECWIKQTYSAKVLKSIRPVNKYRDELKKHESPFTEEYNEWREALVFTAHLMKNEYGDLFDWDKFIDDAKSE